MGQRHRTGHLRNGAIYIVEDDHAVRASLDFFLGTTDFDARQFDDAAAFLTEASSLQPGCVLLDIRMPGIDGFEVLERLRQAGSTLPVVVMTGHGDITTAVRAMKLGARDFLEKPFDEEVLLDILVRTFATLDGELRDSHGRLDAQVRLASLSQREREVLVALLDGQSNKLIAHELGISIRTVEMHRASMMERLGVRTFAEALRLGVVGNLTAMVPARAA